MTNDNPYRTPTAQLADISEIGEFELAGRGHRFGAAMIDGIVASIFGLSIGYATGIFDFRRPLFSATGRFESVALGLLIFVLLQSYFLKKNGQTIGKKVVGIRIVDLDNNVPTLSTTLGHRYLPIYLINMVPVIGPLLAFVDVLFIFRSDRRCIHDLIAKTKVVLSGPRFSSGTWFAIPLVICFVFGFAGAALIQMAHFVRPARRPPMAPLNPAAGIPQDRLKQVETVKATSVPLPTTVAFPPNSAALSSGSTATSVPLPTAVTQPPDPAVLNPTAVETVKTQQLSSISEAAAPVMPKSGTTVYKASKKHPLGDDVRKCLDLIDNEAIIRCAEAHR